MSQNFAPSLAGKGTPALALLDSYTAYMQADVTMTNANQYYDGPTLTLGKSGKYLICGAISINFTGNNISAKLWDGTIVYSAGEGPGGVGNNYITIPVFAVVTIPTTPYTLKISAASTAAGNFIRAGLAANNPGNFASYLIAIRLGP